ncbi:DUF3168 domain-containing protein [Maricaulis sp.]|uniref:DUF3168 domain-containing protein n=1 Tax=Maricaulis sp. TaxID=1486257 RepID=UPI00262DBCB9|nr:DUF3168 domain-containing protein [Maricaulis sp.]
MSALKDIRAAVETALAANAGARALLGDPLRLAASRSRHLAFPHASWGRMTLLSRGAEGVDLTECRLTLDVWCRDGDAAAVTGQLRSILRDLSPVMPAGTVLMTLEPVYTDVFQTANPRIQRGLVRLRVLTQQITEEVAP